MLIVKRRKEEVLKIIRPIEEKHGYIKTQSFRFKTGTTFTFPEEITLRILWYLGPLSALLNIKYYYMYVEKNGIHLNYNGGDCHIDMDMVKYITIIDMRDMDKVRPVQLRHPVRQIKPINTVNLKILSNLKTINFHSTLSIETLNRIESLFGSVIKTVKCINIVFHSFNRPNIRPICREIMSKKASHTNLGIILDKLYLTEAPTNTTISFAEALGDIFQNWNLGIADISLMIKKYDTVPANTKTITYHIYYHPLDVHYFNTVIRELFARKNIEIFLKTIGNSLKCPDYNPICQY